MRIQDKSKLDIKIYTDGACLGNPGPGGYGVILSTILNNGRLYETHHSGGFRLTTNNRMELVAVINGLACLNGSEYEVEIISDSKYVCDAFNQHWIDSWRRKGWRKSDGPLPNEDMWRTLWNLVTMQRSVKFTWIKGHNDHPYNESCDKMAKQAAMDKNNLEIDLGYEASIRNR